MSTILKPVAFGVVAASGAILAKIALQNIIDNRRDEQQHYGAPCYNPQQTDMVKTPTEEEIFSPKNPYSHHHHNHGQEA